MSRADVIDVAIVGAGIIGTTTAFELQERGRGVCLIEPNEPGLGTAAGSASFIAEGQLFPIARASVVRDLPRMLTDPTGPLVIRPLYVPSMLGWGLRFLFNLRPSRFREITRGIGALNRHAVAAILDLAARADASAAMVRSGVLVVSKKAEGVAALQTALPALEPFAIAGEAVGSARVYELEPALGPGLAGGVFYPNAVHCNDVPAFGRRLVARIAQRGGIIRQARVAALSRERDSSWKLRLEEGEPIVARNVVVAAGVWSKALLEGVGHVVPIETERGYHLMLPDPGVSLRRPVVFEDRHFAMTPLAAGLRLAGTVEFAGTKAPMDPRRSDILFDLAAPLLPGLQRDGAVRWMGFRPTFPDSLPAIGASNRHSGLYYNFGHQHLGLTQSAISARCLADLIAQREATVDLKPYRLERFG